MTKLLYILVPTAVIMAVVTFLLVPTHAQTGSLAKSPDTSLASDVARLKGQQFALEIKQSTDGDWLVLSRNPAPIPARKLCFVERPKSSGSSQLIMVHVADPKKEKIERCHWEFENVTTPQTVISFDGDSRLLAVFKLPGWAEAERLALAIFITSDLSFPLCHIEPYIGGVAYGKATITATGAKRGGYYVFSKNVGFEGGGHDVKFTVGYLGTRCQYSELLSEYTGEIFDLDYRMHSNETLDIYRGKYNPGGATLNPKRIKSVNLEALVRETSDSTTRHNKPLEGTQ